MTRVRVSEGHARMVLEQLARHQERFFIQDQDRDGVVDYGTLDQLAEADLTSTRRRWGYRFRVHLNDGRTRWMGVGEPMVPGYPTLLIQRPREMHFVMGAVGINQECDMPSGARRCPDGRITPAGAADSAGD